MEFSRCLINDIEPALRIFQAERALAMFLHDGMHSLMFSSMDRFVCHEVLQENTITTKLMKIDVNEESNLPTTSVNVGV